MGVRYLGFFFWRYFFSFLNVVNKNERVVRRDGEHRVVVLLRRINTAKENNNYRLNGNICGL